MGMALEEGDRKDNAISNRLCNFLSSCDNTISMNTGYKKAIKEAEELMIEIGRMDDEDDDDKTIVASNARSSEKDTGAGGNIPNTLECIEDISNRTGNVSPTSVIPAGILPIDSTGSPIDTIEREKDNEGVRHHAQEVIARAEAARRETRRTLRSPKGPNKWTDHFSRK